MAPHFEFEDELGKKLPGTLKEYIHKTEKEFAGVLNSLLDNVTGGRILGAMADSIEFCRLRYQLEAALIQESRMPRTLKAFAHSANFVSTGLREVIVPVPMGLTAGLFRLGSGVRSGFNRLSRRS